ncbi:uncharacterized protein LOC106165335 [Lingula anatina]|uniref:Uncharacterized protein LOC106165335 n=1 Tax=Lingula anatina TaxID=7574 RepID=A0A1S3IL39_LINAN|nr:uncharacterized protein LOC106165335 [Lingula anatina]|eukprot:XP_013398960.1 uncharacterized protein LOC106165335 [Lingula anatina]
MLDDKGSPLVNNNTQKSNRNVTVLRDAGVYLSAVRMRLEGLGKKTLRKFTFFAGCAFFIAVPSIHMAILHGLYYEQKKAMLDREHCTCACWDTIFKGNYEKHIGRYKHIYFNVTTNTFFVWAGTVFLMLTMYESMRKIFKLWAKKRLRFSMFVLFAISIYPHYTWWWNTFNFLNDDFYKECVWIFYLEITQIVTTVIVFDWCDADKRPVPRKMITLIFICTMHIFVNKSMLRIFTSGMSLKQWIGGLTPAIPDIIYIATGFTMFKKYAHSQGKSTQRLFRPL